MKNRHFWCNTIVRIVFLFGDFSPLFFKKIIFTHNFMGEALFFSNRNSSEFFNCDEFENSQKEFVKSVKPPLLVQYHSWNSFSFCRFFATFFSQKWCLLIISSEKLFNFNLNRNSSKFCNCDEFENSQKEFVKSEKPPLLVQYHTDGGRKKKKENTMKISATPIAAQIPAYSILRKIHSLYACNYEGRV